MAADFATAFSSRMRIGPSKTFERAVCARSRNCPLRSLPSKERHLETTAQGRAFLDATRAAWPCEAIERLAAAWDGPVTYPVAVGVDVRRTRHRARACACRLICMPRSRTGFRPACGSFRSGRPTASACWPRLSRLCEKTVARARQDAARSGRRVCVPVRSRQHAARNAIYETVPVMMCERVKA